MSKPQDYMTDALVLRALHALASAIEHALGHNDTSLKSLLIIVRPANQKQAAALIGCECEGCKLGLLDSAQRICLGEGVGRIETVLTSDGPIKAVH